MGKGLLKFKKIIVFGIGAAMIVGAIFMIQSSKAAFKGEGLTISPPILELTLKPGESSNQTIRITNPTEKVVEFYPKVMNFEAKGEGGEPSFYEATDEAHKYSLARWISFKEPKLALTPEQVVEFKYTISVPSDAEPGGHYGVVFFANEPPKTDTNTSKVSLGSMVGSLVLVRVPGQIIEKAILEEYKPSKNLYFNNNTNILTRIANVGNVHFKPKGDVEIKGWFGEPEKLIFNDQNGNILPNSTRKFENAWKPGGIKIGLYTAKLALTYGETEKNLNGELTFWIIPWWLIVIIVVLVLAIITYIWWRRRRKKKGKNKGQNQGPDIQSPKPPQTPPTPPSSTSSQDQGSNRIILR